MLMSETTARVSDLGCLSEYVKNKFVVKAVALHSGGLVLVPGLPQVSCIAIRKSSTFSGT